ncbi:MAG: hypothetical protein Q9M17_09910 [Mariprofundus sp.]|nr:hypothetical protein [Mariprofundus sp.]
MVKALLDLPDGNSEAAFNHKVQGYDCCTRKRELPDQWSRRFPRDVNLKKSWKDY